MSTGEQSLAATRRPHTALDGTQLSVTVNISQADLEILKGAGYKLCFAKQVGNTFNVVWQSYSDYLASNVFSWTPEFQLFGSNKFEDDVTVTVSTNVQDIDLGQTCILDAAGNLGNASTGGPLTSITMVNNLGSIHPALNQLSNGIDGVQVTTPIYVAEEPIVTGTVSLTPIDVVQVWFEQDIETSVMFSDAKSLAVVVDLTQVPSMTVLYSNGKWSFPGQ